MQKKYLKLGFITIIGLSLVSCNKNENEVSNIADETDPDYYSKINERIEFDNTNPLNFSDSFNDGLDENIWYGIDGYWDAGSVTPHNGVRIRNISYTKNDDETYLAFRGRGVYNEEDPSTANLPEGGVIITQNHLTPGRYEIEMAAFPRFGGVTAMWTYCSTTGNEATSQNEIDIEIGGGGQYQSQWCTTWTTHTNKQTNDVDVTDILYLNDGKMHTYTFDWYTDYLDTGEGRIDWFIDGHFITQISGPAVPYEEMPLWVGCWFPSWAGDSRFYDDYMLVKNISFTAFDSSQFYDTCRAYTSYTRYLPSQMNIQETPYENIESLNKFSNGDFSIQKEYQENNYYGWEIDRTSQGTLEFLTENNENIVQLNASTTSTDDYHGEYLKQTIGGAYPGFKYNLKVDARLLNDSAVGNIEIYYKDIGNITLSKEVIPITSTSFNEYAKEITIPENTVNLEIDFTSEDGSVQYKDASLVFIK